MSNLKWCFQLISRIPNAYFLIVVIILSGLVEGIGLSSLVPVVSSLTGELSAKNSIPAPFDIFPELLGKIGITPSFTVMLVMTLFLMLLSFWIIFQQEKVAFKARYSFLEKIRKEASDVFFNTRWSTLCNFSSGDVSNIMINSTSRGAEALIALINIISMSFQLLVYTALAFILSWKISLVTFGIIGCASFFAKRLLKKARKLGKENAEIDTYYSQIFVEYARGSKIIKAMNAVKWTSDNLLLSNKESCKTAEGIGINSSTMKFQIQMILGLATVVMLFIAVEVLSIKVSVLLVFLYIVLRLAPRFNSLQGQIHSFVAHRGNLELVDNLISKCKNFQEDTNAGETSISIKRDVEIKNVSYEYPQSSEKALKNISFKIYPKKVTALVGRSGSGKTTALDLVIGLHEPSSGSVLIDDKPLSQYSKNAFRKRIGYVSQDSLFFTGSIRDNLSFGEMINDEVIWKSLKIAQLDQFISRLPAGLDTQIGESGLKLSGGQLQRLSICRALVRDPELLILDEATSSLDSESEMNFQQAIEDVANNYTLVVVAHRLSTVKKADIIYVIDNGEIIQQGNFEQLASETGLFAELLKYQFVDHTNKFN